MAQFITYTSDLDFFNRQGNRLDDCQVNVTFIDSCGDPIWHMQRKSLKDCVVPDRYEGRKVQKSV